MHDEIHIYFEVLTLAHRSKRLIHLLEHVQRGLCISFKIQRAHLQSNFPSLCTHRHSLLRSSELPQPGITDR